MEDRDGAASFDKLARQQVAPVVGVSDSDYQPRPVQQPIPIMVGAMSELGLSVAATPTLSACRAQAGDRRAGRHLHAVLL